MGTHELALVAHDGHDRAGAGLAHRGEHVADEAAPADLVQHLRGLRLHPRAPAGGEDDDGQVVEHGLGHRSPSTSVRFVPADRHTLVAEHEAAQRAVSLLSGDVADPAGYGRVVRDADDVAALIGDVLTRVPPSTAASTFTAVLAEVLHAGPTDGEEHTLGDVLSREHVEALTDAALAGTDTLKDALDDLTRSPAVAAVAGRFMARVVSEVVQTNRAMAEKLPGLGSLVSFGAGAAGKVIGATQVDALVGAAAGQGAGFAVRRLNAIVVDTLRDPGTRAAVLEVYGLYADQPLTGLQRGMTLEQAQHLAGLVQDVVIDAAPSEPVQALVRAVAEGFVATYADHPVSEPMVRSRLAPFWESPEVAGLLGD